MNFGGGNTHFGYGAVGSVYFTGSIPTCGNYSCATYGGGGIGCVGGSCVGMNGQPGAAGAVFIEYN
jgi:hypothetical protein